METARERIAHFVNNQHIKNKDFLEKTSLKKGILDKSISKSKLNEDFLAKILESYPELNANWLLMGKGEMLKSKNSSTVIQGSNENNIVNSNVSSEQDTSELVNMIKILENQLKIKDEQINKLIEKIGK